MRSWPGLPSLTSVPLTAETLAANDAVVLITDHKAVDYAMIRDHAQLVVDTRGMLKAAGNVVKA